MSDWTEVGLGELTNLQSGFAFKSSQWTANGVPVVKIANVKPGILDLSGCSFVTEGDAKRSNFLLNRGDILIGLTGYVGAVCQVKTDDPVVLNQRVGVFRPHSDKVDPGFLYQLASSKDFMNRVEAASYGSAQPNVSPKQILAFAVTVPPLAEQREIAATLGALDDKIELNRKTAATLEGMARALYRSWFVDFDPVRARAEGRAPAHMDPATAALFPDSFGEDGLPVGWINRRIGDLLTLNYGKALRKDLRKPGAFPVYGSGGSDSTHESALIREPTIILGRKGTVGSIRWAPHGCWPIDTTFYVTTNRLLKKSALKDAVPAATI